jgi:hypothetical protein
MSCALTQAYSAACSKGIGGAEEAYIIELENIKSTTVALGVVTALEKVTAKRFWKYQQLKETSYGKDTFTGNEANGSFFSTQEVGLVINRMHTAVRNEIVLLAMNRLVIVVKDNNGKFWMYGRRFGLQLSGGEGGTGTALADRNGYTLTFTGTEPEPAIEVEASIAAALETAGV